PMLCLPLPSANTSRYQPCSSANTSPCRAYKGLEPSSVCDMPGAPKKKLRSIDTSKPSSFVIIGSTISLY
ncbi:MAG: hypothetical protein AAGA77_20105, partial [Bacteroidota bacterium]